MKTALFAITGMHCSSCAMNIEGELEDTPGVKEAKTSYAQQRTEVTFDPNQVSEQRIISIIKTLDYDAQILDSSEG